MWLNNIKITNFRCHAELAMELRRAPWVVLAGNNGAGKTSIMEAIYAASRGRSFRPAPTSELIRAGCDAAEVVLAGENGASHRLGGRFSRHSRELHLDGVVIRSLADAGAAMPVEYIGGAAHRLMDGPPAARRRFLDWGLFHVEPRFLDVWRLWHRAHRQRNELLRTGDYETSASWIGTVAEYGEALGRMRSEFVRRLAARLEAASWLTIQDKAPVLRFTPGWRGESLAEAFEESSERERRVGRTVVGPQYDDWTLAFEDLPVERMSRGQAKLASFFLWRELGRMMQEAGRSAILLADDFLADLDENSARTAIAALDGAAGQVWLAVQEERRELELPGETLRFHVEPGKANQYVP